MVERTLVAFEEVEEGGRGFGEEVGALLLGGGAEGERGCCVSEVAQPGFGILAGYEV